MESASSELPAADAERWWPDVSGNQQGNVKDGRAADDNRTSCERDRDRLLYGDEFERLRGVTQVVSPTEGILCHDRHAPPRSRTTSGTRHSATSRRVNSTRCCARTRSETRMAMRATRSHFAF